MRRRECHGKGREGGTHTRRHDVRRSRRDSCTTRKISWRISTSTIKSERSLRRQRKAFSRLQRRVRKSRGSDPPPWSSSRCLFFSRYNANRPLSRCNSNKSKCSNSKVIQISNFNKWVYCSTYYFFLFAILITSTSSFYTSFAAEKKKIDRFKSID